MCLEQLTGCLVGVRCTHDPLILGGWHKGVHRGSRGCCGNPEEGEEGPTWSTRVGFPEEAAAGAKSLWDGNESCFSQPEGGSPQEALRTAGGLSQRGWGEPMEKLPGVGEISAHRNRLGGNAAGRME